MGDRKYFVKFPDGTMIMYDNLFEYNMFSGGYHTSFWNVLKLYSILFVIMFVIAMFLLFVLPGIINSII